MLQLSSCCTHARMCTSNSRGKKSGGEPRASVCDPSALRPPQIHQCQQLGAVLDAKLRFHSHKNVPQTFILPSFLHLPALFHSAAEG